MVERVDYETEEEYQEALMWEEESERRQEKKERDERYADYSDQE